MEKKNILIDYDERRNLAIFPSKEDALQYAVKNFIEIAGKAIRTKGRFAVALSGGSTPKGIYEILSNQATRSKLDWTKVYLFWSDERNVPPDDPESNFKMAMEAGLDSVGIPIQNIFRMQTEGDIEAQALDYESLIKEKVGAFDLVMLGMGEDGHTASLFPFTHGLHAPHRLVVANYVPQLNTWRMTLTFDCINNAENIAIYVIGKGKRDTLQKVLAGPYNPDQLPSQKVGTTARKALWIMDEQAYPSDSIVK